MKDRRGGLAALGAAAVLVSVAVVSPAAGRAEAPRANLALSPIVREATPVADTYAERYGVGGAGTVNHGADETLVTGYSDAGGTVFTVYVRFNVEPLLQYEGIASASLGLYARGVSGGLPDSEVVTATLHVLEDDWDELALTGENAPILGPQFGETVNVRKGEWTAWDVTDLVRRWESGEPNHGVAVLAHPIQSALFWSASFDSREAELSPRMRIEGAGGGRLLLPALANPLTRDSASQEPPRQRSPDRLGLAPT